MNYVKPEPAPDNEVTVVLKKKKASDLVCFLYIHLLRTIRLIKSCSP